MKASELREKSYSELLKILESSQVDYFKLKFRHESKQFVKVSVMKALRKDIARLETVIREHELRG
jgi:large subunit ribosomal protein L29